VGVLATIRDLVDYDRSVSERFERSMERRSWKEGTKNRETGHLSIAGTMVHILNVHEAWMVGVAQGRWEIFDDPRRRIGSMRSWKELRAYRDRVWSEIDRFVEGLTERKLSRRVRAPWMPGRYTLSDAFFQTSVEQAHHLGEIIGVYWQLNRRPPDMTWIENLRQSRKRR